VRELECIYIHQFRAINRVWGEVTHRTFV
jgi:hypothetical protein